jgi:Predicted integral membrane protein (DUF2269)
MVDISRTSLLGTSVAAPRIEGIRESTDPAPRSSREEMAKMNAYDAGLFVHLVAVIAFFGGAFLTGVAFEAARRHSRPGDVALLLGLARIGALAVVGGTIVLLGAGLWLAHRTDQFGEPWLLASLGLFLSAVVLGALGGRRPRKARELATSEEAPCAEICPELAALLEDRLSALANYVSLALALVLMVWQPVDELEVGEAPLEMKRNPPKRAPLVSGLDYCG